MVRIGRSVRRRPSRDRQASRPVAHQVAEMYRTSAVGSQTPTSLSGSAWPQKKTLRIDPGSGYDD